MPAPGGLFLECRNEVPHGRGLGSSATAIVTGIVAAQALHDVSRGADDPTRPDLGFAGTLAARLEGRDPGPFWSTHMKHEAVYERIIPQDGAVAP